MVRLGKVPEGKGGGKGRCSNVMHCTSHPKSSSKASEIQYLNEGVGKSELKTKLGKQSTTFSNLSASSFVLFLLLQLHRSLWLSVHPKKGKCFSIYELFYIQTLSHSVHGLFTTS